MIDAPSSPPANSAPRGIVAGIGLRANAGSAEVLTLLDLCLASAGLTRNDLTALATLDRKLSHAALVTAAAILDVPVLSIGDDRIDTIVPNPSARVRHHMGLNSVAEAAAMRFGTLLVEKQRSANVTCALARLAGCQDQSQPRASNAASTLPTSWAGP